MVVAKEGQELELLRCLDDPTIPSRVIAAEVSKASPDLAKVRRAMVLGIESQIAREICAGGVSFAGSQQLAKAREVQWEMLVSELPQSTGDGWDELLDVSPLVTKKEVPELVTLTQMQLEASGVDVPAQTNRPKRVALGPDKEVMERARHMVLDGKATATIAKELGLTERTIERIRAKAT